jgi:hypothetical protein
MLKVQVGAEADSESRTLLKTIGIRPTTWSGTARKYSNAPLPTTSRHDRQHTELAGTTAKRPAAPLVRDEEAPGSNPATPTQVKGHLPQRDVAFSYAAQQQVQQRL